MYTEEEAKTKWCPMVRVSDGVGYAAENRFCQAGECKHDYTATWHNCIASDCMMWRKEYLGRTENQDVFGKNGCCGLAGQM